MNVTPIFSAPHRLPLYRCSHYFILIKISLTRCRIRQRVRLASSKQLVSQMNVLFFSACFADFQSLLFLTLQTILGDEH